MMKIEGVEDIQKAFNVLLPRQAQNLMRSTVHGVAKIVRDDSREFAPEDEGVLKQEIFHRREKSHPDKPVSVVYVGDRAFYWRFPHYGTGGANPIPENPFFWRAIEKTRMNIKQIFIEEFGKKLEAFAKREAKKAAKK
jgi:HK97 gp10 family phage protein